MQAVGELQVVHSGGQSKQLPADKYWLVRQPQLVTPPTACCVSVALQPEQEAFSIPLTTTVVQPVQPLGQATHTPPIEVYPELQLAQVAVLWPFSRRQPLQLGITGQTLHTFEKKGA